MFGIRALDKRDISYVAQLHIDGIKTGFISSLGSEFVEALYKAVAEDKNSFGFVAEENDRVLGFIAFSKNLNELYKYVALTRGIRFAFILVRKIFSWRNFKKIIENILYPGRMRKMKLPQTELLSIVVAVEGRGKGVAEQLLERGFYECKKQGIDKVKVLVGAGNEAANKLYQKRGFELISQAVNHGVLSNIYVKDLTKER